MASVGLFYVLMPERICVLLLIIAPFNLKLEAKELMTRVTSLHLRGFSVFSLLEGFLVRVAEEHMLSRRLLLLQNLPDSVQPIGNM